MFFILSKTLFYLLMPLTWILACLLLSLFSKKPTRKKLFFRIGLGLLLFFTNPFFINEALLAWEMPPTEIAKLKTYDVGIVLTGVSNAQREPKDRLYLNKGGDRLLHTLQLYKMGKIRKILISGGHYLEDDIHEGKEMKNLFVLAGIPESDIVLEEKSLNTRENAQFSAQILKEQFLGKSYLLITSAFHLRRAKACFERANIQADVFSVDFYSQTRTWLLSHWLAPNEKSLYYWYVLIHELLGYAVYKAVGYA
ncbi:MAG: YdcF family protein [Raineya sp.]